MVYTDHSVLRYLFAKKDAKSHLIRWILLLQEFDLTIKAKKGSDNVIVDHLSRLPNASSYLLVNENFPDEQLLSISIDPLYDDIVNYLVTKETPSSWSKQDKYKFMSQVKYFYWDDPYLFKYCPDQII